LGAGTTYYYIVTAVNGTGESVASSQVSAATAISVVPPAIPTGITATGGTNQVTISWSQVSGATSYNIYWTNDPSHVMKDMGATQITGVTSPYRHTNLGAGKLYAYVVTAVNGSLESAESDIASATTSAIDGVALYTANCSGCHNPLAISEKKGRTSAQIQAAIAANRGGMGSLATLTAAQTQAIADILGF
jgi:fibronectin type 3 domain-containing protein